MKLFLAVCKSRVDGAYFVSNHLYASFEEARHYLGDCCVGLFLSGPFINVPDYKELHKVEQTKGMEESKKQKQRPQTNEQVEFSLFNESFILPKPSEHSCTEEPSRQESSLS